MRQEKTISSSIGLLIGVVIAILALVRGVWQLPLLIGTFAVWGLWLLRTRALPLRCAIRPQRRKHQSENFQHQLAQTLLYHVNYRVSDCLKASYPTARWEWTVHDPALFAAQGGTGRIRVYGVPDYEFADVTVDQRGKLSCALIKLTPVEDTAEKPAPPDRQPADPRQWYEAQGRKALETLVDDLASRGHSTLTVQEDGSICICPASDRAESKQGLLDRFPSKDCWPVLAELLEADGLTAAVQDGCIAVTW